MTIPTLLTVREAARQLGVSESWLNKLRLVGGGPNYVKLGRRVVYETKVLQTWVDSNIHTSTSSYGIKPS